MKFNTWILFISNFHRSWMPCCVFCVMSRRMEITPKKHITVFNQGGSLKSRLTHLYGELTARHARLLRPLTTKMVPNLHHLFVYQDPPLSHPLIGSSQLWAKHFPYLYPSTPILGITSTIYAYEDGTANKFRNVGTKSSDARRLPRRHNTGREFFSKICRENSKFINTWQE